MTGEPPDLRDLVGDDLEPEELARLQRVDALLRSVPAPPSEVPPSLASATRTGRRPAALWTRRRILAGLALAAAIAAVFFAVGLWTGGASSFETVHTVRLAPTARAAGASGLIRLGARDDKTGNWPFEIDVSGLPPLKNGDYYVLWLTKDGRFAGACGTFDVGPDTTTVRMSASYSLDEYDKWVVTAWVHGRNNLRAPWLLEAPTQAT